MKMERVHTNKMRIAKWILQTKIIVQIKIFKKAKTSINHNQIMNSKLKNQNYLKINRKADNLNSNLKNLKKLEILKRVNINLDL